MRKETIDYDKNKEVIISDPIQMFGLLPDSVVVLNTNKIIELRNDSTIVVRGSYGPGILVSNGNVNIFVEENAVPVIICDQESNTIIHAKGHSHTTVKVFNIAETKIIIEDNAKVFGGHYEKGWHCDRFLGQITPEQGIAHKITNPKEWCDFYGVPIIDGIALLGKGVLSNYNSERRNPNTNLPINYKPGTIPVADDWDGGAKECGGGLHFSPNPKMVDFFIKPGRRLICPVRLEDIAVHPDGNTPYKCKAKGCCEPVWEVGDLGIPIDEENWAIWEAFLQKHGDK